MAITVGQSVPVKFGWYDYNDVTTQTTPIDLTVVDTDYFLTNDGAGEFTQSGYKVQGHGDLWDTSNNQLDFSSLAIGDIILYRLQFTLIATNPNTELTTHMYLGVGDANEYSFEIGHKYYKSAGTYDVVVDGKFYIGNTLTLNNPGKIAVASDTAGASIKVNGWFLTTLIR